MDAETWPSRFFDSGSCDDYKGRIEGCPLLAGGIAATAPAYSGRIQPHDGVEK
jgi:hypothetical protein